MSTPQPDPRRSALEYLWGQYKVWDETSETYRKSLSRWRPWVLFMAILGGVLGALSTPGALPFLSAWENWSKPPSTLGVLGGILLGLSAFFTRELLSPERESRWVRARAAAEAFKREAYLMAAQAPPYEGAITPASLDRAQDLLATTSDMQEVAIPEAKKREELPRCPMTVSEYITGRLDDQMNKYYRVKAASHARVVQRIRTATVVLGAAALVLSYLISREIGGVSVGIWVSVITAITSSLAAYLYARRLQYLVTSYLAAARNLEALRARWTTSGKTDADTAERNQLILDCEKILSSENNSWISEWFKKETPTGEATPGGGGAGTPGGGGGSTPGGGGSGSGASGGG